MYTKITVTAAIALFGALAFVGCLDLQTQEIKPNGAGGQGGSGGGAAGQGGGEIIPARQIFDTVEPDLVKICSPCHKSNGGANSPFLDGVSADERYTRITSWPGVIVKVASTSVLLTYPGSPSHEQWQAPDLPVDLRSTVQTWLAAEAAKLQGGEDTIGPAVKPFAPLLGDAVTPVSLESLGSDFQFMSISFNAKALGGTPDEPTMLRLTNISVLTELGKSLHIVHPLFYVYGTDGVLEPDPIDSFADTDQIFTAGSAPTLGTGEIVLTNWRKGASLVIAFKSIEVLM